MVNKNNLVAKKVAWPSKTATKRTDTYEIVAKIYVTVTVQVNQYKVDQK